MGASGLVGSVGSLVGFESAEQKAAGDAMDSSLAISRETLAENKATSAEMIKFNQDILDKWEATFGSLEDNLNSYYSNLDPVKFATQNKTSLYDSMSKQMKQLNETLSSSGLMSSGMRAQAEKEAAFRMAESSAAIDMAAPEQVAQMQQGWLSGNKATEQNAIAGINQAYAAKMGVTTSGGNAIAGQYQARAQQYADSSAGYMNFLGTALGIGASMYPGGQPAEK